MFRDSVCDFFHRKVLVVGGGLTITGVFVYSSYAVVNGGLKLFELDFVTLYVFAIILILFLRVLGL
jgi:hypothetical protein